MEYKYLKPGDVIQDGDEYRLVEKDEWWPFEWSAGGLVKEEVLKIAVIRRKVSEEPGQQITELEQLRAELAALNKKHEDLVSGVLELKSLLAGEGEYCISRLDKKPMWIVETLLIGGIFEKIDSVIGSIPVPPQGDFQRLAPQ